LCFGAPLERAAAMRRPATLLLARLCELCVLCGDRRAV